MKKLILALIIVGLLVVACETQVVEETPEEVIEEEPTDLCPDCDDNNPCTEDLCNEGTDYECAYRVIIPCCGNGECEENEDSESCPGDCEKQVLSEELQGIVTNQQKIKSYKYSPYGNQIANRIHVKGDQLRYDLHDTKRGEYNNKYDSVFLDTTDKTAWLVCTDLSCENRNVAEEADYNEFIMETPMEMIEGVTYKGDILGTEICDTSKPCNKVEVTFADGESGKVWLGDFYGFPYKIEKDGTTYEFVSVVVNAVKDEDVTVP